MNTDIFAPVSAVIPCWRSGATIRRAVDSIAAQTLRPREVLVVDDASGDGTLDRLHALSGDYPAGWLKVLGLAKNSGPGGARNAGWDQATQPWIAFLDADDAWHPRKIELQYGWLQSHPYVSLSGHGTTVSPMPGVYPEVPPLVTGYDVNFAQMLVANRFPTRSVMLRRELPFRFEGKQVTEDYMLWLQVVLAGHRCHRLHAPLAVSFREDASPGGYSGQLWRHEKRELAAWRALHRSGSISSPTLAVASTWSLVKYLRRRLKASPP